MVRADETLEGALARFIQSVPFLSERGLPRQDEILPIAGPRVGIQSPSAGASLDRFAPCHAVQALPFEARYS